tara:strand:- start:277 stop:1035 length:759 start_codon:yes stop_codon:yes gene_type:complete
MTDEIPALTDALEQNTEVTTEVPATEEFLGTLVGEGKKFIETEQLAKSYHHANLHIEELKSELQDAQHGKSLMQEVLDELRKDTPPVELALDTSSPAEPANSTDDIARIVDAEFSKRTATQIAKSNVDESMKALSEIYGDRVKALKAVKAVIGEDESLKKIVDDLSKSNPATVVKFVSGIVPIGHEPISNTPGVAAATSAESIASSNGGLTWNQCREIKKSDPSRYQSSSFRATMEQAVAKAANNGVDFFAT